MRKALTLAITLLGLQAPSAFAIVGGPWDFNDYGGNQNGVYQAVLTGKNLSGMCRFSEGTEAQISVFNVSNVFYKGVVYFGSCFGIVDKVNKRVYANTSGSFSQFQTVASGAGGATQTGLGGGGGLIGGGGATAPTSTGSAGVIGNCNTTWRCKIKETAPILRFKGKGIAYFFGDLDQTTVTSTRIESEPREYDIEIDPDTGLLVGGTPFVISVIAQSLTGGAVQSAFSNVSIDELIRLLDLSTTKANQQITTEISSGGQDHIFPDLGVQVRIDVFGNQISYGRGNPITPSQDGLTGTGSGGFLF